MDRDDKIIGALLLSAAAIALIPIIMFIEFQIDIWSDFKRGRSNSGSNKTV
ncbi:MAG: hypothetical protein AAGG51_01115 [Cyanobacteria bacterium P01_G01_bin.54]